MAATPRPDLAVHGARVVTPGGVVWPGWVRIAGDRIADLGAGRPPPGPGAVRDLAGGWVLPGLVDLHVHGGGGASLTSPDPAEVSRAVRFHRRHGTTHLLASLVTAPVEDLVRSLAVLAELTEEGVVDGAHLEGPFLSPRRCGAQDPRFLLRPDPDVLARLLRTGRGTVRMVTVAPELPGALDLIRRIGDAGAAPAIGHTDATYDEVGAAVDAGARVATHLYNAMRPPHHREPGPVHAVLERGEVTCEIIADGVHLHPAMVRHVLAAVGPARVALITDAMAAAGMPDGTYQLGPAAVRVEAGRARLADRGAIAGSTLTTGAALRWAVKEAGVAMELATQAGATTPAVVLGLGEETGTVAAGRRADLVLLHRDLDVDRVMVGGQWVEC